MFCALRARDKNLAHILLMLKKTQKTSYFAAIQNPHSTTYLFTQISPRNDSLIRFITFNVTAIVFQRLHYSMQYACLYVWKHIHFGGIRINSKRELVHGDIATLNNFKRAHPPTLRKFLHEKLDIIFFDKTKTYFCRLKAFLSKIQP
ncbi:hypothetical protein CIB54_16550 [Pseudomonas fluorescens]|uniref:Uncharacterized protein n=1 Tax=Pseudomonas fluorescens TaxID=294 RepID=A0A2N1E3A0_PSEFL|nr:hypothetical protein CIB54_16550 [Pseudomonas fluorescens]